MKLTQKQRLFADYYLQTANLYESAIKAGYSHNYSKAQSYKLLENVGIKEYLLEQNKKIEKERVADMQEVREMWSKILRMQIEGVDMKDVLKASEYIAKTNGAFLDKVEHTGDLGLNVKVDYGDSDG
jgi:phage terminase small subunit